jgi:Fe-S cluster biogenesis protein NfuA
MSADYKSGFKTGIRVHLKNFMDDIEIRVHEVLHNLNWLLEAHDSSAELVKIEGNQVVIKCIGPCATCETDCIGVAFKERMPEIDLVYYNGNSQ